MFVPEARIDSAPWNAFYAYGEAMAFGFSPFAVDSAEGKSEADVSGAYAALGSVGDLVLKAQAEGKIRGVVMGEDSPRATQTVALGGYLFQATMARSWPERKLLSAHGAMVVMETGANEFYVAGSGLYVSFARDPDVDDRVGGIERIEEVRRDGDGWVTVGRLNGDQSNQGRQLQMGSEGFHVYRVKLYATGRTGGQ